MAAIDVFLNSNAAGYKFSINTGFGVPDASVAVHLAKQWANKEPLVVNSYKQAAFENVPDDGLLVEISFNDAIIKFNASPGNGLVPDEETNSIPIVDVGRALNPIDIDLTDKAAFIQRGGSVFSEKVKYAADAGASFVIIYNNNGGDERFIMGDMQFVSIPAAFLSKNDGDEILKMMANTTINPLKVKLNLNKVSTVINVPDSMICEQVGVRVEMKSDTSEPLRVIRTEGVINLTWFYISSHYLYLFIVFFDYFL